MRRYLIDEPTPFDTAETWADYLAGLNELPADALDRQYYIDRAERTIAALEAGEIP